MNAFKDDKGHWSSIRIIMILSVIIFGYMVYLWREAFMLEILKEKPDYGGLTTLFTAMVAGVGISIFAKVVQKYFEK